MFKVLGFISKREVMMRRRRSSRTPKMDTSNAPVRLCTSLGNQHRLRRRRLLRLVLNSQCEFLNGR